MGIFFFFKHWNVFCSGWRICFFISTVINSSCLTCTDTFFFHLHLYLLLISADQVKNNNVAFGRRLCPCVRQCDLWVRVWFRACQPPKAHAYTPPRTMRQYSSCAADGCSAPLSRYESGTDEPSCSDKVICSMNRGEMKYIYEVKRE